MSKKWKLYVAVGFVVVVIAVAVWLLVFRKPAPPEVAVPEPPKVEAPEPVAVASTPEPLPSTDSTPEPEPLAELPKTENAGSTLIPVPAYKEPEVLDPEIAKFLAAMKEKSGADRLKTMKCKIQMEMQMTGGPQGQINVTMNGDLIVETPNKVNSVFEMDMGKQKMKMYQVSDGVFMEIGSIDPQGKRVPMQIKDFDASGNNSGVFTGQMFDPAFFKYEEMKTVEADPKEYIFQKEDGSPLDNLSLTMLKASQKDTTMEMFVDPVSMEMKAWRIYKGGEFMGEASHIKYATLPDDITHVSSLEMSMNPPAMNGQPAPGQMKMKMQITDVEANTAIDPSAFKFALTPPAK